MESQDCPLIDGENDRFRTLFEQSMDAVYIGTPGGAIIDVNQAWLDLFGYTREDLPSVKAADLYANPADRGALVQRILESGEVKDEILAKRKDGSTFLCQRTMMAQRDETGTIVSIQGVNRDVSALRQTEAGLRDRELRYRSLFEQSMDAIYIGTPDGVVIDVNQAWLDLFGYAREELPRLRSVDYYADPADRADFVRRMNGSGYVHDEVRYRRKGGTVFDCQRIQTTIKDETGKIIAYQGINRDITARKQAEAALRESEERFRTLFEHSLDAIALVSPGGLLIEANHTYLNLFGYAQDDIGTLNVEHQYVDCEARTAFLEWMATHDSALDQEMRLRRRDGVIMDCLRNVVVRRDSGGNVIGEQCVVRDVTQHKKTDEAFRASEQRFRTLFERSTDAIYVVDYDGSNIRANPAWLKLFGYSADEMSRLNIIEMYANPDDRKDLLKAVARKALVDDEVRFKRKDGMEFDCARTVTAQRDEEGNIVAFQGIMRDVTEQKRARAELEHLAHFDTLTGLLNRHAILDKLDEWLRQSNRYKGNLSIAMVDIDHFKRVNDLHGHLVGDRVLSDTADALRRSVRLTDFVGRYGGEEFLLILPQTGAAGAMAVAERTRRLVMRTPMVDAEGGAISVTVSLGVAEWCHGDDADVLIGRADAALYRAKAAGRNRVEATPCPGSPE